MPEPDKPAPKAVSVGQTVFVFIKQASSMAVMNLGITGQFVSPVYAAMADESFAKAYAKGTADFLPFTPNPTLSTGFMSPFTSGSLSNYHVEYDAELCRRAAFTHAPSRLTSVYAFDSMEACQEANRRYRWDLSTVVAFEVIDVLRSIRVNMEIVSLARHAYAMSMLDGQTKDHLWRSYWTGANSYAINLPTVDGKGRRQVTADALWELLIDGQLQRADRKS
jgi:hypothetical protein